MAERRATNKYYPPEWDPSKGSINTFVGQHPLRDRARKLDQGILIVRFELPYSIWCSSCHQHIGKGVRYNAEKKQVGKYFTTPIFNFRCKCHLCSQWFEIETDPKNHDYIIKKGAEKRTESWDSSELGVIQLPSEETSQKMAEDPFFRLEHLSKDKEKAKASVPRMEELIEFNEDRLDDFSNNSLLRAEFRKKKREGEDLVREGKRKGFNFALAPKDEKDLKEAEEISFKGEDKSSLVDLQKKKAKIASRMIFGNGSIAKKEKIEMLEKVKKEQIPILNMFKSKLDKGKEASNKPKPLLIVKSKPKEATA